MPGNTPEQPVLVEVEAVEEAEGKEIIAVDVEEVDDDEVEEVLEMKENQDEIIDEKDDCTDDGSDPDEPPRAPYTRAELNAFSDMLGSCGNNLKNCEKLGRHIKESLHVEEKEKWSALEAAREEGDTVLEVMKKMYGNETKKKRTAIRELEKLEEIARDSFDTTFFYFNRMTAFKEGGVMAAMNARAIADCKRIEELEGKLSEVEVKLSEVELERNGLLALQYEYRRILKLPQ
jgi:hypothetical protein